MIWRGIAIGILISAPMGPVGILCIQRTLDKGRRPGFYTGVGAAISDLFYCLLTGFGLSFIQEFLEHNQNVIQLVGSAVLIGFGIYLFKKNPASSLKPAVRPELGVTEEEYTRRIPIHILQSTDTLPYNRSLRTIQFPGTRSEVLPLHNRIPGNIHGCRRLVVDGHFRHRQSEGSLQLAVDVAHQPDNRHHHTPIRNSRHRE